MRARGLHRSVNVRILMLAGLLGISVCVNLLLKEQHASSAQLGPVGNFYAGYSWEENMIF